MGKKRTHFTDNEPQEASQHSEGRLLEDSGTRDEQHTRPAAANATLREQLDQAQTQQHAHLVATLRTLQAKHDQAVAEVASLKKVLSFYADPKNWKDGIHVWGWGQGQHSSILAPAKDDAGERARLALSESSNTGPDGSRSS